MSPQPIARSADLQRLRSEGYTVSVVDGFLVVGDVPYVDDNAVVHDDGKLVMALTLSGDVAQPPSDHTTFFVGIVPCTVDGRPLEHIMNSKGAKQLAPGLESCCRFSAKPKQRDKYTDFYEKVTTYVGHVSGPAQAIDETVTPKRHRPVEAPIDDGPFNYVDTASSRAGIVAINDRFRGDRIGIVGVGGTGSYVLDQVAKTPVAEIHLYDADRYLTHNAFRSPGAPSIKTLTAAPLKVEYLSEMYSNMHRGIVPHPVAVDETNVHELADLDFVFVCVDDPEGKAIIAKALQDADVSFVDVGMGVLEVDGRLTGVIRTTASTPTKQDHVENRISFGTATGGDEYASNIQIAELNALNASLAVIRWKKLRGIYADLEQEHHSTYAIDGNHLVNEDAP